MRFSIFGLTTLLAALASAQSSIYTVSNATTAMLSSLSPDQISSIQADWTTELPTYTPLGSVTTTMSSTITSTLKSTTTVTITTTTASTPSSSASHGSASTETSSTSGGAPPPAERTMALMGFGALAAALAAL